MAAEEQLTVANAIAVAFIASDEIRNTETTSSSIKFDCKFPEQMSGLPFFPVWNIFLK